MNQQEAVSFKLSGKCPPQSFLYAALAILIAVPIMGMIYGALIHYCPIIYVNFFLTIILGFGIALVVSKALQVGKMRNLKVSFAIGLLAGLVAVYCSWITKIYLLTAHEVLAFSPLAIFQILAYIAEEGAWEIGGYIPTGFALYAVWGIEALVIIGLAAMATMGMMNEIFCEACNRWVGSEEVDAKYYESPGNEQDLTELVTTLTHGNPLHLKTLPPRQDGSAIYLKAETSGCETCEALNFLSVELIAESRNKEGEITTKSQTIIDRIFLKPSEFEALREGAAAA